MLGKNQKIKVAYLMLSLTLFSCSPYYLDTSGSLSGNSKVVTDEKTLRDKLNLRIKDLDLEEGKELDLNTYIASNMKSTDLLWLSENTDIATVGYNTGKTKGIREGTSVINVVLKNTPDVFAKITIKVSKKRSVLLIKIDPPSATIAVGDSKNLQANVQMANGEINSNVIWSSSDDTIAKIDSSTGKLTAVREGTVTITATYSIDNLYKGISEIKIVSDSSKLEPSVAPTAIVFNPSSTPIPSVPEPSLLPTPTPTPTINPSASATQISTSTPTPTVTAIQNPMGSVSGKISGESGVTVTIKGTSLSTATDSTGSFTLSSVPVGLQTLVFTKANQAYSDIAVTVIQNQVTNVPDSSIIRKRWLIQLSGVSTTLYDLKFVSTTEGWVVGDSTILHTTNGGISWEQQNGNIANTWYGVDFVDKNNGCIVGASGKILTTTDGGKNWKLQTSITTVDLKAVSFVDANTGWASSTSNVLNTVDGGNTWKVQSTKARGNIIQFINKNNGYVCYGYGGDGYVTTNGGTSWQSSNNGGFNYIQIFDVNNIFGYSSYLYKSTDGGLTWIRNSDFFGLGIMYFVDKQVGFAFGGDFLRTYKTIDGGITWNEEIVANNISNGHYYSPYRIKFVNETTGWAVGNYGAILKY